jgi:integrase
MPLLGGSVFASTISYQLLLPKYRQVKVVGTWETAVSETAIIEVVQPAPSAIVPGTLVERARSFAADAKATRTRKAYRCAWESFATWCDAHGLQSLPATPETLALYVTARAEAGRKPATITLDVAGVCAAHRTAGRASPSESEVVRAVLQGIRRQMGAAQRRVTPLTPEQLRAIVEAFPAGLLGVRDRALLVIGFAGAFRRSELVALDIEDVAVTPDGIEIQIRRSKTDQTGEGRRIGLPFGANRHTCPVRSFQDWLQTSGITTGPLWRPISRHGTMQAERLADRAVALIVKRSLTLIGLDATTYAGHSLRAGLITAAARAGKAEHIIAKQSGHRSVAVLRRYIRDADLFTQNAAGGIGL